MVERQPECINSIRIEQVRTAQCEHEYVPIQVASDIQNVIGRILQWPWLMIVHIHHTTEQRMLGARLIVDLSDGRLFIVYSQPPESDLAARVIRFWKACSDAQRYRIQQRGVDVIVDERSPQGDLPARIARG